MIYERVRQLAGFASSSSSRTSPLGSILECAISSSGKPVVHPWCLDAKNRPSDRTHTATGEKERCAFLGGQGES